MSERYVEANVLEKIADAVGGVAGTRLAYGDPIERDDVTVVPVARVRFGFGGGGGQKPDPELGEDRLQGSGGGGGVIVSPVGFLILGPHEVKFHAIRDPARLIGLVLVLAFGARVVLRALRR